MATEEGPTRKIIARAFTVVEDIVYVGLGLLLGAMVLTLFAVSTVDFARGLFSAAQRDSLVGIVSLLDRVLLILLIVELLYTVQVSFRAHALSPEPFLLVGLISAIRRVLLLTTSLGETSGGPKDVEPAMLIVELAVLAGLILVLSGSLLLLRRAAEKPGEKIEAKRA